MKMKASSILLLLAGCLFLSTGLANAQTAHNTWDTAKGTVAVQVDLGNRSLTSVLVGDVTGAKFTDIQKLGMQFYRANTSKVDCQATAKVNTFGRFDSVSFGSKTGLNLKDKNYSAKINYYVLIKVKGAVVPRFFKTSAFQAYMNKQVMSRATDGNWNFGTVVIPTNPTGRIKIYVNYYPASGRMVTHTIIPNNPNPFFIHKEPTAPITHLSWVHFFLSGQPPYIGQEIYPFKQDITFAVTNYRKPFLRFNLATFDIDRCDIDFSFMNIGLADAYLTVWDAVGKRRDYTIPRVADAFQIELPTK